MFPTTAVAFHNMEKPLHSLPRNPICTPSPPRYLWLVKCLILRVRNLKCIFLKCLLLYQLTSCQHFYFARYLKCYYDQILDIHFFTFSHTTGVSKMSCQISIYYEQQNSCFLNLSFREFTAAINFPCSKSGLRIGENDIIFSKIPHGLKL